MKEFIQEVVTCPVSLESFIYPLITNNGHTYEKAYIDRIILDNKPDPVCRGKVVFVTLNRIIKDLSDLVKEDDTSRDDEDLSALLKKLLTCPLSKELFIDPVITNQGYTYERRAIKEFMQANGLIDPFTRQPINCLIKNYSVLSLCETYRKEYQTPVQSTAEQAHLPSLAFEQVEPLGPASPEPVLNEHSFFNNNVKEGPIDNAVESMVFDSRLNCYEFIKSGIMQVFHIYQKLSQDEGLFNQYMRQTLGYSGKEVIAILNKTENKDLPASLNAIKLLEQLRALMWYHHFPAWRADSIQQLLMTYLLISTGLYETAEIQWGNKPKNCQGYYALFHTLMNDFIKNYELHAQKLIERSPDMIISSANSSGNLVAQ